MASLIRRDTDYAMRVIVHLALIDSALASCGEIARECRVPKSFAHKILKKMTNADLVESVAGRNGGYRLNKAPRDISLRETIEIIQGPTIVNRCVSDPNVCPLQENCPVTAEWCELQDNINGFLEQRTLHDVLSNRKHPDTGSKEVSMRS